MTLKIDKKIKNFKIITKDENLAKINNKKEVQEMSEKIKRPEFLTGTTYKIKSPKDENAMYITINDILLNSGTEYEIQRPFEIFISSKNMEHYQWTVALTLIISAVFRKGGDCTFLVEELKSVFDPSGGYLKKGGIYMPSLVAEIGYVIEKHLKKIGLIENEIIDPNQKSYLQNKISTISTSENIESSFPKNSQICSNCKTKAMIRMDGCLTCLSCGYSKCG